MSEQNFIIENGVLVKYTGTDENVIIPNGINKIADRAFIYNKTVKTVVIPEGVESIGNSAFSGAEKLSSIVIPDTVKKIGRDAFYECRKLKKIVIPEGVKEIKRDTFRDCKALKEVSVPESIQKIEELAFYGCIALQHIDFPEKPVDIERGAFRGCKKLADADGFVIVKGILFGYYGDFENVIIPDSVERIESRSLDCNKKSYEKIKSVVIPESVKTIEPGAFYNLVNLADSNGFITIRNVLYRYCGNATEVSVPDGVVEISSSAFSDMEKIVSVKLPESVIAIRNRAFVCTGLVSIALPVDLTVIGDQAFYGCSKLNSINIPEKITSIPYGAFSHCEKLKSIHIPETVTEIGGSAFCGCTSLSKINVLENVTKISAFAFDKCIQLKEIHFTDAIEEIHENYAFGNCRSLTVYAPENSIAISYAQEKGIPYVITNDNGPIDINKLSKEEIINLAVKKFTYNVSQIELLMKRMGYSSVYPSENNTFYPYIDKNADADAALEFFGEIEKILNKDGVGFDEKQGVTADSVVSEIKNEFLAIVENKKSTNGYCGIYHIRTFVAVGLACYYFLSTKTKMDLEFNRDKWEAAGDYCSAEKVAFRISEKDNGGKVLTQKHKAYDNFG